MDAFNESKYTLGIFIDLSKAFDTVDHEILLKKSDMYSIKGKNFKWFHSCLTNRKQFLKYCDQKLDVHQLDVHQDVHQPQVHTRTQIHTRTIVFSHICKEI